MYLHLDSLHVPLGIVGNGWWVFMRRGLGRVVISSWVVCGNFASSKNWTRWPIGTWLTSPSLQICQVTSWSHVVPGREHYKCVIDQAWGQDGWILTEFNFLRHSETSETSRGPLKRKKRTRLTSSHLDRTSLVNKRFYYIANTFR